MGKIIQITVLFIVTILFTACGSSTQNVNLITPDGYKAKSTLYTQKEKSKDYIFILLHGKAGNTQSSYRIETYENLASKGYEVLVPKMPWSKDWEGTLSDGIALIDQTIEYVVKQNKKPILVGHSLGGAISLIYTAQKPHKNLAGTVVIAPGHMLHESRKMRKVSHESLQKAIEMINNNQGDEKADFKMVNTGKIKKYHMKAKVFRSYYDTNIFPSVRDLLEDINTPLLWIAGKNDRLTRTYAMSDLFELLPENDSNEYIEINGSHTKVVPNSTDKIISWSEGLK